MTVVTGPSGAGKSSLAFDTIFAEGQRRFVESMSTYARQFLDQMERPPVDAIDNVLPAVALEAKNAVRNARSTVGTITETHGRAAPALHPPGRGRLPARARPGARASPRRRRRRSSPPARRATRSSLVVRLPRPQQGGPTRALGELIRQGFQRRLDGERGGAHGAGRAAGRPQLDPLPLVLGRFRAGAGGATARILDTLEEGYRMDGGGRVEARGAARACGCYSRELACPVCGEALRRPTPALFSFNSPLGACPTCQGFGRVIGIDRERVDPRPAAHALRERPIAPWNTPAYEELYDELLAACAQARRAARRALGRAAGERPRVDLERRRASFANLDEFFEWLEARTYKVHVRVLLARYRSYNPCPDCGGTRLQPEALAVRLEGRTLPELAALSVEELRAWLARAALDAARSARSPGTCSTSSPSASRCSTASASTT